MDFFRWYWRNWEWKDNVIAVLAGAAVLSIIISLLSR